MNVKRIQEKVGLSMLRVSMVSVFLFLFVILYDILKKGTGIINWEFLYAMPRKGMTEGGIFPAIIGTFLVTVITAILAVPLGIGCAVYLNEFASNNKITRLIRMAIRNLSGVPSIVYGLFGVILFVQLMHMGGDLCIIRRSDPWSNDPSMDDYGERGGLEEYTEFL